VTDLAWLNDLDLSKLLCQSPVPILTGIGHERDNTIGRRSLFNMATGDTAVKHDIIGLAQRQVELLRIIQDSREEYQQNQDRINRSLSAGSFVASTPAPSKSNGNSMPDRIRERRSRKYR
jgi:Exonuclease VII, large subunit